LTGRRIIRLWGTIDNIRERRGTTKNHQKYNIYLIGQKPPIPPEETLEEINLQDYNYWLFHADFWYTYGAVRDYTVAPHEEEKT
jgi:hypothetical protein